MENIIIAKDGLEVELCPPDMENGYYRGTRFDHSGIFRRIIKDGFVYADEWFDAYDPYKHDAVCGTSEEFACFGYEEAAVGGVFLKPGVGLLIKADDSPYDHFRLYEVADSGKWTVEVADDSVRFVHVVEGDGWGYEYEKIVRLAGGGGFEISHKLLNTGSRTMKGDSYNHNFFTFGETRPGPDIEIDFQFEPSGNWRAEYDSVALSDKGIRFSRALQPGESVFMGNLNPSDGSSVTGEVYVQRGSGHAVTFCSDKPFDHIAFWSNHRVSCIEPFIPFSIEPGQSFVWNYDYRLL